jgi:hypothetical protein
MDVLDKQAMSSCLHRIIGILRVPSSWFLINMYIFVIECSISWFSRGLLKDLVFYGQLHGSGVGNLNTNAESDALTMIAINFLSCILLLQLYLMV